MQFTNAIKIMSIMITYLYAKHFSYYICTLCPQYGLRFESAKYSDDL